MASRPPSSRDMADLMIATDGSQHLSLKSPAIISSISERNRSFSSQQSYSFDDNRGELSSSINIQNNSKNINISGQSSFMSRNTSSAFRPLSSRSMADYPRESLECLGKFIML